MSVQKLILKTKLGLRQNQFESLYIAELQDYISSHPRRHYWMRPANDTQSQRMAGTYLSAIREDLKHGGYIFIMKSKAADLFRQLEELDLTYKPVQFENMADISSILNLDEPQALWVIVEDDGRPLEAIASRFKVAQVAIRNHLAPPLGTPVNGDKGHRQYVPDGEGCRKALHIMFIEMNVPSVRGFSVVVAQARSLGVFCCTISKLSKHDHYVMNLFGEPEHSLDERKALAANSVRIYGAGPKHKAEFLPEFRDTIEWHARSAGLSIEQSQLTKIFDDDTARLTENYPNLGVVFDSDDAHIVHLSR